VWREIRARKNRNPRRVEVMGLGLGDVYCFAVNAAGERHGDQVSVAREGWESRYQLVSEAAVAVPDANPATPVRGEDYGGGCGRDTCPCARPGAVCGEWMGQDNTQWCPRCSWARRYHPKENRGHE
jgi:hypothetical protein